MSYSCAQHGWQHLFQSCPSCQQTVSSGGAGQAGGLMDVGYKQLAKDYDRAVEQNKKLSAELLGAGQDNALLKQELAELKEVMIVGGNRLNDAANIYKAKADHALESVTMAYELISDIYNEKDSYHEIGVRLKETLAKLKERYPDLSK